MGCDIHAYLEYQPKNNGDCNYQCFGEIDLYRNYLMFSIMAGVRGETVLFSPRGFPEKTSFRVTDDNFLFISDSKGEGFTDAETAKRWVKYGSYYKYDINGNPAWVSNPDWHSHSWLTCSEFKQVLDKYVELEQQEWEEIEEERKKCLMRFEKEIGKTDNFLKDPYPHNIAGEYQALLACMENLESLGYETRLVFWFDN